MNEYFNNAPVGEIFAGRAKDLKPVYLGAKNQACGRTRSSRPCRLPSRASRAPEAGWDKAIRRSKALAEG